MWEETILLVDTGASTLFLRDGFARALGYEPGRPSFKVGGLTGPAELPTIRDVGLRLGGAEITKTYVSLVPILPPGSGMPDPVGGVAGFRLFQQLRATLAIDYDTNLATLRWP